MLKKFLNDNNYIIGMIGLGLSSSTFMLGILHLLCSTKPYVTLSLKEPLSDINVVTWRGIVSLQPSVLLDHWLPLFIGLVGICAHKASSKVEILTSSSMNYLVSKNWIFVDLEILEHSLQFCVQLFNIFKLLFADLGYGGTCGITVGLMTGFLCILLILNLGFANKGSVSLEFMPISSDDYARMLADEIALPG